MKMVAKVSICLIGLNILLFQNCARPTSDSSVANNSENIDSTIAENSSDLVSEKINLPKVQVSNRRAFFLNEPHLARVNSPFGKFKAGDFLIVWKNTSSSTDVVTLISESSPQFVSTVSPVEYASGIVKLAGTTFRYGEAKGGQCFTLESVCDVRILGPLSAGRLTSKLEERARLDRLIAANVKNLKILREKFKCRYNKTKCNLTGTIDDKEKRFYPFFRAFADLARASVEARRFIYKDSDRKSLDEELGHFVQDVLEMSGSQILHSDYDINRSPDAMTTYHALRALESLRQAGIRPDDLQLKILDIWKEFSKPLWKELSLDAPYVNLATYWRKRLIDDRVIGPNGFGQIAIMVEIGRRNGVDVSEFSYLPTSVAFLLRRQNIFDFSCDSFNIDAFGKRTDFHTNDMLYGGWLHLGGLNGSCAQKMGYHEINVSGLMTTYQFMNSHGLCGSSIYKTTCQQVPYSIAAALVWILNMHRSDGFFWNIAPGTLEAPPDSDIYNDSGTVIGLSTAWELIDFLSQNKFSDDALIQIDFNGNKLSFAELRTQIEQATSHGLKAEDKFDAKFITKYLTYNLRKQFGIRVGGYPQNL